MNDTMYSTKPYLLLEENALPRNKMSIGPPFGQNHELTISIAAWVGLLTGLATARVCVH